jgi:hypothetical protein
MEKSEQQNHINIIKNSNLTINIQYYTLYNYQMMYRNIIDLNTSSNSKQNIVRIYPGIYMYC